MESRTIIHLDLDAFYCAVEELQNPDLRGKPFAVGGSPENRGVVSSCSYAARGLGIRSAMPMARARQICPELIILSGSHREYGRKSRQVMEILRQTTTLVEQLSIDEAFLDVSEIEGDKFELACSIQSRIMEKTSLPSSLGIASNKLVAKIATDIGKASVQTNTYPNAIQQVPPGQEAAFLAPLPMETLWGVGPKTAETLQRMGMENIGDLASWPVTELAKRLGKHGYDLHARANGIDNRPVTTHRDPKSISQEITFSKDTNDRKKIAGVLQRQSQQVTDSLKRAGFLGSTVKLKLRWADFTTITRQITLTEPTDDQSIILEFVNKLLRHNWDGKMLIRLIGIGISGLQPPSQQLSLWDKVDYKKMAHLEAAIHQVRSRFGEDVIHRGATTSTDPNTEEE
jgi:DNA polymerase-4